MSDTDAPAKGLSTCAAAGAKTRMAARIGPDSPPFRPSGPPYWALKNMNDDLHRRIEKIQEQLSALQVKREASGTRMGEEAGAALHAFYAEIAARATRIHDLEAHNKRKASELATREAKIKLLEDHLALGQQYFQAKLDANGIKRATELELQHERALGWRYAEGLHQAATLDMEARERRVQAREDRIDFLSRSWKEQARDQLVTETRRALRSQMETTVMTTAYQRGVADGRQLGPEELHKELEAKFLEGYQEAMQTQGLMAAHRSCLPAKDPGAEGEFLADSQHSKHPFRRGVQVGRLSTAASGIEKTPSSPSQSQSQPSSAVNHVQETPGSTSDQEKPADMPKECADLIEL